MLLREDGALTLIDNAHTAMVDPSNFLHLANSVFLPGSNFHARNRHGFQFLHCCSLRNSCGPKVRLRV